MKSPPSRWWHVIAVLVFLAGALGMPGMMFLLMFQFLSGGEEFEVPGTHTLQLDEPGAYTVWNVTSTFRDGQQYHFSDSLPSGTRIRIREVESGIEIPTTRAMNATETSGSTTRRSVCRFTIESPGAYDVVVDQTDEKRLLMVRRAVGARVFWIFFLAIIVSFLCWIIAPAISIIVEVRRYYFRREQADKARELALGA